MPKPLPARLLRYGGAVVALALATALRQLLDPVLGSTGPFVTYFAASMVVAWYAGVGPALVALVGGTFLAGLLFVPPSATFSIAEPAQGLRLGLWAATNLVVILLIQASQRYKSWLALSERRFQHLLEASSVGVGLIDEKGGLHYANPALQKLAGWATEDVRAGQVRWDTLAPPEFVETVRQLLRKARSADDVPLSCPPCEQDYLTADGRRMPILASAVPFEVDEKGEWLGAVFVTDLTPIRQAEEALHQSEERLRLATQAGNIGLFDANCITGEEFWSAELKAIFGLAPEAAVERDATMVPVWVHPDDREQVRQVIEEALRPDGPGETTAEHRILRPDGTVRWVMLRGKVMFAGEGAERRAVRAMGSVVDITERRHAEKALAESEARFREVVRLVPAILYRDTLPELCNVFISPAIESYLGFTPKEWLGNHRWQQQIHHADRLRVLKQMRKLARNADEFTLEYRSWHKDGKTLLWFEDRVRVERDDTGRPVALFGAVSDITDHKRAEQTLLEADRRKDEFLATLAHELRNPLAPISNAFEVIRRQADDPEVVAAALTIGERQLHLLIRLVDDLLNTARITRGKITLHREPTTLQTILAAAMETSRLAIDAGHHRVTLDVAEAPIHLHADPTRLAQAVSNLLINAAKYMDAGGHIHVRVRCESSRVIVAVQDTGIGLAPENLPHLFELFMQADRPRNSIARGLGIGLPLTKALIELHGGTISAASAGLGLGSTFTITLPLPTPKDAAGALSAPGDQEKVAGPTNVRRILVVDDNVDVADGMTMLLTALGHQVDTAYGGAEAMRAVRRHTPDIALIDIGMPDLDGCEVARRLRRNPRLRHTKLVALTGWGQEEDRRRTREAGFDAHLVKPVSPDTLERIVSGMDAEESLR